MSEEELLFEDDIPYPVPQRGRGAVFEIDEVFVTTGAVNLGIFMDSQVEAPLFGDNGFIQCREQYVVLIAKLLQREYHESVVLSGIAERQGSTEVSACTIGAEDLPVEGIFQIDE